MRKKLLRMISNWMKPCHYFQKIETGRREYLRCGWDGAYRKRCKTRNCPHFTPTGLYKIACRLGMARR